jgi:hypothetical protein
MSRSKKKPYITDQQNNGSNRVRLAKRRAARKVRAEQKKEVRGDEGAELANGKAYRKASCSWDIRDYASHCPDVKKAWRK